MATITKMADNARATVLFSSYISMLSEAFSMPLISSLIRLNTQSDRQFTFMDGEWDIPVQSQMPDSAGSTALSVQ